MAVSAAANLYVNNAAPWAKANAARAPTILATLLEVLRALSVMMWPAMPKKSDSMRAQLGLPPVATWIGVDGWPSQFAPRPAGEPLLEGAPLFPMIDKDAERALLERLVPPKPPTVTEAVEGQSPDTIAYEQFAALDLRVGVVRACEKVPKKDKLLKLTVDLGEPEPRTIIAGLALTFAPEQLLGRRIVVVANLAPRDFGKGLVSHGMLLATGPSESLHLATIDETVSAGERLT
jgi:methionyl-tRNA synthetase